MLDIVLLIPTLIIYCIQLSSLFRHSLIPTGGTAHQIIGKTETEGVVQESPTAACIDSSMPRRAQTARARSSLLAVLILVCICLCCFLPPSQEEVQCSLFLSKKVPVQVEAVDWVKSLRLLIGGIQLTGHLKVEPAADLASLSHSHRWLDFVTNCKLDARCCRVFVSLL